MARMIRVQNVGVVGAISGDADVEGVGGPGSDDSLTAVDPAKAKK